MQAAHPIIYEALDFSVGLTDAQGNLIAQGQGTTVLLAMLDSFIHDILEKYGAHDDIHPGDVFCVSRWSEAGVQAEPKMASQASSAPRMGRRTTSPSRSLKHGMASWSSSMRSTRGTAATESFAAAAA